MSSPHPDAPPPASVFEPVADRFGPRLALVFGNAAPGGECPWFATGRCGHCDIGAGEGRAFAPADNLRRLEWFRARYAGELGEIAHLVVYNSGSVLNPREMPAETLAAVLDFARALPALRAVSLDSREPFIRAEALSAAASRLGPAIQLRPILGLESADDAIRDGLLRKAMPRAAVLRAFDAIAAAAVGLDVNVVVAGPGTTPDTAADDAAGTARFVFSEARARSISADLNIHPYYPSRRGRELFPEQGRCTLPVLRSALDAIQRARADLSPASGIFIGWQDEGHDTQQDLRSAELARAREAFERYNRGQDPGALEAIEPE
ncbi:MAG: hypothetical protein HYY18_15055 [Planctomycetes bacterium]|nr:hypothetical protein [Planctomycetota bacterium]